MKPFSSTSSCRVRQKQKTSKRYAPMPLRQPLQDCSRYMGSSTMHRWHGKASRMLLHSSENQRSMHPFGSFSIVLKRKRILPQSTLKIHPNDKTITRHFFEFRTPSLSGLQVAQMTVPPCKETILQAKSHEDHRAGASPRSSSKNSPLATFLTVSNTYTDVLLSLIFSLLLRDKSRAAGYSSCQR